MAIANTFVFDWALRLRTGANVNLFILNANPIPDFSEIRAFLGHSSLRLVCNHSGYGLLWHEQVGDNWREKKDLLAWPVLDTESARWEIRSAIDAVVAVAYHINRSQYEHILQSFDRSSGPNPYTNICLEKYDELAKNGQTAFVKKHDPYWDVPLFEELSKPVINPPKVGEAAGTDLFGKTIVAAKKKGKKK
jgi:hypothetical protein